MRALLDKSIQHFQQWWKTGRINKISTTNEDVSITNSDLRFSCERILLNLQTCLHHEYNPKNAIGIRVQSTKSNFNQLFNQLKGINSDLMAGRVLSPSLFGDEIREMSLDDLFISENNCYIAWAQIISFHQEALKLCRITKDYEQSSFGKEEHNLRILATVFLNIRSVGAGLLHVLSQ
jgi:hypothetical protein